MSSLSAVRAPGQIFEETWFMHIHRYLFTLWAILALCFIGFSEGDAALQKKNAAPQKKKKAPAKEKQKTNFAPVVKELHKAKHLLDTGLHDYKGHRAKADAQITKAIHLLQNGKGQGKGK